MVWNDFQWICAGGRAVDLRWIFMRYFEIEREGIHPLDSFFFLLSLFGLFGWVDGGWRGVDEEGRVDIVDYCRFLVFCRICNNFSDIFFSLLRSRSRSLCLPTGRKRAIKRDTDITKYKQPFLKQLS